MKALINKIIVTERIRKEVNKIDELAADITMNGLINPVTVMPLTGGEYRLLAGLRRIRAFESLGFTEIDIHIVSPADAEAELRIEVSENEQRESFTFSEQMDFARLLEEIEKEKAKNRKHEGQSMGGKIAGNGRSKDESCLVPHGAPSKKEKTRDVVAGKIGMGKTNYDRAKYIVENASDEIIDELDKEQRTIRGTYDELKANEKAAGLLSKSDEEAIQKIQEFNAMSPLQKVEELKRRLKEERIRANHAESELARLKELRHNDVYHKDGIIKNLTERLADAEARILELEAKYCPDDPGCLGKTTLQNFDLE